jgi:glycosyltransferase involved in cell wall biosynthesis
MRLLMASGDRQVVVGERGPFWAMLGEFSQYFDRIDVLCPRPAARVTTRVAHGKVHFHPAPCGRLGSASWIRGQGARLHAEYGHELIVSHDYGWFYNGFGSASLSRATGVPYLSEIHHVPGYPIAADLRERFDRLCARVYVGWARERAVAFRVVNHDEMPHLLRSWRVPLEKILVLPSLYIDLDLFRPETGDTAGARRDEYDQDLVFVGRLVRNKCVDRILEAVARLAREGRRATLLVVGKGPLRSALQERSRRLGLEEQVRFVEWIDSQAELANIYRRSRLCVCASTCEGGPRYTVEAMACGTPVVSTPVGMMGDLLDDGEAGRLAAFDHRSLAAAIGGILDDEKRRRAMGARAVEKAAPFEYSRAIAFYANGLRLLIGKEIVRP